jgi:hypothetical protein
LNLLARQFLHDSWLPTGLLTSTNFRFFSNYRIFPDFISFFAAFSGQFGAVIWDTSTGGDRRVFQMNFDLGDDSDFWRILPAS